MSRSMGLGVGQAWADVCPGLSVLAPRGWVSLGELSAALSLSQDVQRTHEMRVELYRPLGLATVLISL